MIDFNALDSQGVRPQRQEKPVFSVTEISQSVKRLVEGQFGHLQVRGEISGFKRAASGHLYFALKDQNSVIDGVCWRGNAARTTVALEDGMEVICTGKLTTYPGRSKYQMVVDRFEPAGQGALLALLEKRKQQFKDEGLFNPEHKQQLPFLPRTIGVVTSPTGAVIRDILHRISDRFPSHVMVWPVLVQGDEAAKQIAAAIEGFNALPQGNAAMPRPDILIVARGGGSLEDLWCFNEEEVVRAAFASKIPLVSAVGHETDTTLIDYVSDRRAPTPTGAAEMIMPVRSELLMSVADYGHRAQVASFRKLEDLRRHLKNLSLALGSPKSFIGELSQRLDDRTGRLNHAIKGYVRDCAQRLQLTSSRLLHPKEQMVLLKARLGEMSQLLKLYLERNLERLRQRHERFHLEGSKQRLDERFDRARSKLQDLHSALNMGMNRRIADNLAQVSHCQKLLESYSFERVMERGFAVVRTPEGKALSSVKGLIPGKQVSLVLSDGERIAKVLGQGQPEKLKPKKTSESEDQGQLF